MDYLGRDKALAAAQLELLSSERNKLREVRGRARGAMHVWCEAYRHTRNVPMGGSGCEEHEEHGGRARRKKEELGASGIHNFMAERYVVDACRAGGGMPPCHRTRTLPSNPHANETETATLVIRNDPNDPLQPPKPQPQL